jgi:multidrug efflux system outer membrane protein
MAMHKRFLGVLFGRLMCQQISLALLCHSCVMHPKYVSPIVEVAPQWKYGDNSHTTMANIQWWQHFHDPELDCLIERALKYNREIKIAICRVAQFYARLGIVSSELYPQIFALASASKQEESLGTLIGPAALATPDPLTPTIKRITDLFSLSINLSYELDLFGRIQSATEAAYADLLGQVQIRKGVVLMVACAVANSYFHLRSAQRALAISTDTLRSYQESYKIAKLRFDEGLTSEMEAKQAQSQIPIAERLVIEQELAVAEMQNLLSILVGVVPTDVVTDVRVALWPLPPAVPAGLPAELLLSRPDIGEAEQQLIAANALIGVARAEYFPRISLTALFGFESFELKHLFRSTSRTWMVGGNAVQSIFSGGRIRSQVAEAEAFKCEAYWNYEQVVLNAFKEVEDALIAHRKAKELAAVEKERVVILKEYHSLATLQYNNGQSDYLNVLDAERNLFAAQLDYTRATSAMYVSLVDIYKALGGGWVDNADQQAVH